MKKLCIHNCVGNVYEIKQNHSKKSVLSTAEPTNLSQAASSKAVIAIAISQLSDRLATVICLPAWAAPVPVLFSIPEPMIDHAREQHLLDNSIPEGIFIVVRIGHLECPSTIKQDFV